MEKSEVGVYMSLGSNIGNREGNLNKAVNFIGKNPNINILKVSSIYETEPMYVKDQDFFYNIVLYCRIKGEMGPLEVLDFLKAIEHRMGRKRSGKRYGPRIIDIDLLYYGNCAIKSEFLTIPHPKIAERKFVLIPLNEISPGFKVNEEKIEKLLKSCSLSGKVTLVKSWQ